jgi:hypothetical protein
LSQDLYKGAKPALMIKAGLDLLHDPGEVFEVRIPKTKAGTISGYFNDTAKAAAFIARENGRHPGIYVTINPVRTELLARAENVLQISQTTTVDAEIVKRRWFILDFDPVRPTGISSTEGELLRSKMCAESVEDWLTSLGWPPAIHAASGNGWHLLYRVDEPNDDASKTDFECATKMLASIFTDQHTSVDISVFNASRIWKVYGTISAKGSSTEERPHRVAHVVKTPDDKTLVTRAQIENVARPIRDAKSDEFKDMTGEYILDMVKWLADRGQTVTSGPRPLFGTEGQKWTISKCPFNPQHVEPIVGLVNNRPVYRCLHNSCSAFRWKEFREKIDPSYKDPDTVFARLKEWCDSDSEVTDKDLIQSACATAKKLDGIIKRLRKECPRPRVLLLEDEIKAERRRFIRETIGENNEKGNLVGLLNRVRSYQAEGIVPMYWVAEYDHRIRVGMVGDVECPKATDADEIALMFKFHSLGDSWVRQIHCAQVIRQLAEEYRVNPLKVMLKQKRWDGIKRIDNWLPTYMGTLDTEYERAIGRKWLISAVARAMEPGCQADHMLIFEGKQGVGKSQAARILGGQFYVEYSGNMRSQGAEKDLVAVILGKMVVEMSELATLRRADMESLKAMLSKTVDDVRLSYERDAKSYPRTCVFIGTTNEINGNYIMDATGARRFWPTQVGVAGPVRTPMLKQDVDQLWAEAVEAYEAGENWYEVPKEKVAEEQSARQVLLEDADPWYHKIRMSLTDPDSYTEVLHARLEYVEGQPTGQYVVRAGALSSILGIVLGIDTARQTAIDASRVRQILVAIGFKKVRPSKGWMGSTYAYDLSRDAQPHLWSSVMAAKDAVKFPKTSSSDEKI